VLNKAEVIELVGFNRIFEISTERY